MGVGGMATAAYLGAGAARTAGGIGVPIASITALALLASTPLLARVARWAGSPRPARAAAWSLAGVAPVLYLGAKIAIGNDAVVSSHWRCGTGDIGFIVLSPIAFVLAGSLGGLLAFAFTGSRERPGPRSWTGMLARGALLVGAILVAAATSRALHHPSTDATTRYLESIPTVAVLPPINPATARETLSPRESAPSPQLEDEIHFGELTAQRRCSDGSCSVALRRGDSPPPAEPMWDRGAGMPADQSMTVQHDAKHGFWIVGGRSAFRDRDLHLTDINVQDVGDELSAPTGWIVGGAAGVVVALGLWAARRRVAQRPLQRDGAPPDDPIAASAREAIAAAQRARIDDLDALALVSVMLTAAPLVASWGSNLLF
jgi:hypothetical protein